MSTARKKAGWLTKQGGSNKGWKRRWCVFENNCLAYFKSEQDREYAGIVYVEDMRSITIDQEESRKDNRYPYCFRVDTPDRAYMFCAESAADMDDWISMFKSVWQEEPRYLTGTLQFATAECFVDSGLRINGAVEASVLSVFSEGITPKQKRKDERGWFIDKQVSVTTVLATMSQFGWTLSNSLKTQAVLDNKNHPVNMLVFTRPFRAPEA